jgi:hypothetical protein
MKLALQETSAVSHPAQRHFETVSAIPSVLPPYCVNSDYRQRRNTAIALFPQPCGKELPAAARAQQINIRP